MRINGTGQTKYMTYVAGFGGSMDVRGQGLEWGAWRAEGPHRLAGEGTVQEVGLAYMLVGLKIR